MQGRCVFSLCALLLWASFSGAQQTSTLLTVDDLVRTGIQNNQELASVRQRVDEAKGLTRQAGVRPPPVLSLSGATGKPLGTIGEERYGADYSQTVETFGKRAKRIRVAGFSVGIAEADFQRRSTELAFEIRASYAEVCAERHKLKLLADQIKMNQEMLRLTDARVKEGDVAPLEANLLRVELNRTTVAQRSAQGRLASAELKLRRLTGIDGSRALPDTDIPVASLPELDVLKQEALQDRAELKRARLEEEQEAAGVELAKAEAKPDLTLSAGYARQDNQFDNLFGYSNNGALSPLRDRDDVLSFGVSIPLRTNRSGSGNVQAATARTSGAHLRREYLERTIPLEVEAAYQQWRTASESLQMLESGVVDPSVTNLSVIREAYRLGQLRLLDVLNEQRRLVDTQLAYIDAQADVARIWAEAVRAAGGNHL